MKPVFLILALTVAGLSHAADTTPDVSYYLNLAQQKKLAQDITWQRLMYANTAGQSEVSYKGYFLAPDGKRNLQQEMQQDIQALFQVAEPNQSVRCKFPARSRWLMQQL
ncbi:MAG TPA: hypothetical protein DDX00_08545, partial [Acinetobacter radioresistens]|nr:hypothetical protein [Acinetobacter radioresistens]